MKTRLALLLPLLGLPAFGYIEATATFGGVIKESDVVARGTVDAVSVEKKVVIVSVGKAAKGKPGVERVRIDLSAGEAWHPELALKHAVVGTPVVIFYKKAADSDQVADALVYLNRFFLAAKGDQDVWRFTRIQTGLNKVFTGTPPELAELAAKVHSGRSRPPAPNAQLKPWTKDALDVLPLPPKEGEAWPAFDPGR